MTAITEYDIDQETEFNRLQLGTRIPQRLQELAEILNTRRNAIEEWHFILFDKLINSVARICQDLLKTIDQPVLPAAAWNARNLLELWVWISYCSISRNNAWRFHEDALRDMQGIVDTIAKMCEIRGLQNSAAPAQQKIQEVALRDLGVNSLDSKFLRVSDAAIDIGLGDWYSACNKNLSKLAHPTAGLVLGMMHQGSRLRNLQAVCTTQGLFFAGQCVIALDKFILAIPTT